jgi:hypothetical protein
MDGLKQEAFKLNAHAIIKWLPVLKQRQWLLYLLTVKR